MEKRILITGGAGFIGSHLADHFSKKNDVISYDTKVRKEMNICNFAYLNPLMKDVDYVLHLAALVSVPKSMEAPGETNRVNVKGSLNVLKAAEYNNVKKVVFFSSAAVYDDSPYIKSEDSDVDLNSPYAISKFSVENYMKIFSEQSGIDTVSFRCFNVYGPRQDPRSQYAAAIPKFIKKALAGSHLTIFGDGEQTRDFVYVKDVVEACDLALKKSFKGDVFNVASGTITQINTLTELILGLTKSASKVKRTHPRPGDVKCSYASINKINQELGFKPKYSLEDGLDETIEWFKTN